MNRNTRLTLQDTVMDMLIKICEGNPGALTVCMKLIDEESKIDPDSALAPYGTIMSFDTHGVYGSHIWTTYKDICNMDITKLIGVFRAIQLGFMDENELLSPGVAKEKLDGYISQVKERLPKFAQEEIA